MCIRDRFSYCSYTPAITEQVLLTNLDAYNGWLDLVTEGVDQPSAYFYNVHVPRFETPIEGSQAGAYDYVYLHSWESEEARQQGSALFESSGSANADDPCTEVFCTIVIHLEIIFRSIQLIGRGLKI